MRKVSKVPQTQAVDVIIVAGSSRILTAGAQQIPGEIKCLNFQFDRIACGKTHTGAF